MVLYTHHHVQGTWHSQDKLNRKAKQEHRRDKKIKKIQQNYGGTPYITKLAALKTVYEEELRGLQSKVRSYRYELRKSKKERRGERSRKGDVFAINGEVERRLDC